MGLDPFTGVTSQSSILTSPATLPGQRLGLGPPCPKSVPYPAECSGAQIRPKKPENVSRNLQRQSNRGQKFTSVPESSPLGSGHSVLLAWTSLLVAFLDRTPFRSLGTVGDPPNHPLAALLFPPFGVQQLSFQLDGSSGKVGPVSNPLLTPVPKKG